MLGEKRAPISTVFLPPVTRIKHDLTFIHDQQYFPFFRFVPYVLCVIARKIYKTFHSQVTVIYVQITAPRISNTSKITKKVTDYWGIFVTHPV